jgi:rubrerythrin
MTQEAIAAMHAARFAEKEQALFYRALAALAEAVADAELSERLNGLHADEQHHLSRLTVRLVELDEVVPDLGATAAPAAALEQWETDARRREEAEIARYEELLRYELDDKPRTMLEQFVAAERGHATMLGGKWMGAEPW